MSRKSPRDTKARKPPHPVEPVASPGRWQQLLPVVLLVVVSCCAYLNADHEEFLFDSAAGAIENHHTRDLAGTTAWLLRHPFSPDAQLAHVTLALNYAVNRALGLKGFEVTTFLIFNVMVHALNACLVFFLLRALLQRVEPGPSLPTWVPLVPALLFAILAEG